MRVFARKWVNPGELTDFDGYHMSPFIFEKSVREISDILSLPILSVSDAVGNWKHPACKIATEVVEEAERTQPSFHC